MRSSFFTIYRTAATLLATLLLLTGCGGELPQNATPPEPHTPCHEPFTPTPLELEPDKTDYRALAEAVFEATGLRIMKVKDFPVADMTLGMILVMPVSYLWTTFLLPLIG